jgi:hypothetical protein
MRIRRFASAILTWAVRRAAQPRVREWGNAMLREMDFVENDWAALFWALGSATALFKHLEAPMSNLSDVLSRTQALMKKIRRRTLIGYAVCLIMIATCARFFFVFHNTLQRVGSGLTLAATLYIAYQLYERGIRTLPPEIRPAASTDFYRAELARERDFQCGIRFWFRLVIPSAGVILILIGSAMADPGSTRELAFIVACFIGLCIVEVPINRRLSRKYQRQMDELDALPKES